MLYDTKIQDAKCGFIRAISLREPASELCKKYAHCMYQKPFIAYVKKALNKPCPTYSILIDLIRKMLRTNYSKAFALISEEFKQLKLGCGKELWDDYITVCQDAIAKHDVTAAIKKISIYTELMARNYAGV